MHTRTRMPASTAEDVDRSTDDTVGHEADVATRRPTTRVASKAATPIKKGVPDSVKARAKSKPRFVSSTSPAVSRVPRRSPPLTARVAPSNGPVSSAHRVPHTSRVRSVTPGHTAQHDAPVGRRRSVTPGTVRSLSAGGGGAARSGHTSAAWEELVSQQRSRHAPRESSDSVRFLSEIVALRNEQQGMSPRSLTQQQTSPSAEAVAPVRRKKSSTTPSPAAGRRKLATRQATHKSDGASPSWGRLLGALEDDVGGAGTGGTGVTPQQSGRTRSVASPLPRRALTMTQAQPTAKRAKGPVFVAALPLPQKPARHNFTVVFDLDQVCFAHQSHHH